MALRLNVDGGLRNGSGAMEHQMHPSSGLRVAPVEYDLFNNETYLVDNAVFGSLVADASAWTEIPLPLNTNGQGYAKHLPFPMTLCGKWINTATTGTADEKFLQQLKLRVTGVDQFGNSIVETTPYFTINTPAGAPVTGTVTTYFWLSKIFSIVDKIEYQAANVAGGAVNSLAIGFRWVIDLDVTIPANTYILGRTGTALVSKPAWYNCGIGLPMHVSPYVYGEGTFEAQGGKYDILSGLIENVTSSQIYNLPPLRIEANPNGPTGGFLIGQASNYGQWENCQDKAWPFFSLNAFIDMRRIDAAGAKTITWTDRYRMKLWVRTSIGSGRPLPRAGYPSFAESRSISS